MKKLPRHVVETNRRVYNQYMRALKKAKMVIRSTGDKEIRKDLETELSYMVDEINRRGFDFFPDVYVTPVVEQMKELFTSYK